MRRITKLENRVSRLEVDMPGLRSRGDHSIRRLHKLDELDDILHSLLDQLGFDVYSQPMTPSQFIVRRRPKPGKPRRARKRA